MLDLDDILPTMLVCRQFFACKHLTILCKDLSGFILGNLKDYSLDDILPTMLVCKQFFFRNLVPRLIEFGPIVIDMNEQTRSDIGVLPCSALKLWNGICANNIIFVVVYKIVRSALRNVVQNTPECPACTFVGAMRRMKFCES